MVDYSQFQESDDAGKWLFLSFISLGCSSSLLPCLLIVLLLSTSWAPIPRNCCSSQPELLISVWKYNGSHLFCVKPTMVMEMLWFNAGVVAVPRGSWQQSSPALGCVLGRGSLVPLLFPQEKMVFIYLMAPVEPPLSGFWGGLQLKNIICVNEQNIAGSHFKKIVISWMGSSGSHFKINNICVN